jgi:GT2 family glycosyltransferase
MKTVKKDDMSDSQCMLSVVVVNINQRELLEKCLRSIFRGAEDTIEVIVVDNESTDGSCEMVSSLFPKVRLMPTCGRRGFAENYNVGILAARGKYLLILNNDAQLLSLSYTGQPQDGSETKFLDAMVQRMEREPEVACLGPMLLYPSGGLQVECARNLPTLSAYIFALLHMEKFFPGSRRFGSYNMTYWDHATERFVDCISGACMLVRKSVLDSLGGFDERFFLAAEDADLCKRIRDTGFFILYCPEFKVIHVGDQTIKRKASYAGTLENIFSLYKYFKKHFGAKYAQIYRMVSVFLWITRILLLENGLVGHFFGRSPLPVSDRLAACIHLLKWRSMYTGINA